MGRNLFYIFRNSWKDTSPHREIGNVREEDCHKAQVHYWRENIIVNRSSEISMGDCMKGSGHTTPGAF